MILLRAMTLVRKFIQMAERQALYKKLVKPLDGSGVRKILSPHKNFNNVKYRHKHPELAKSF